MSAFFAATVTVPFGMGTAHSSTTVMITGTIFWMSIVFRFAFPSSSTVTGTDTSLSPALTVSVPSVGASTFGMTALPSEPVVFLYSFPFSSTIVTVAPDTPAPLSVTVIVTSLTGVSLIVLGFAMPLWSTFRITVLSA